MFAKTVATKGAEAPCVLWFFAGNPYLGPVLEFCLRSPKALTSVQPDLRPSLVDNNATQSGSMSKSPLSPAELTDLIANLHRLSRNLWWTWNQKPQEVFVELSPRGWQNLYHNAVAVLRELSDYELRVRLQDPDLAFKVQDIIKDFDDYLNSKTTWGHRNAPALREKPVAYFSAEFGFHETLPVAAGGLGILAADHAKSGRRSTTAGSIRRLCRSSPCCLSMVHRLSARSAWPAAW
jgi:hypothetical protein